MKPESETNVAVPFSNTRATEPRGILIKQNKQSWTQSGLISVYWPTGMARPVSFYGQNGQEESL